MRTLLSFSLALCVAGLLACGKAEEPPTPDKATSGKLSECCQETADLQKQIPSCCKERLTGGELSECCKASDADPAKMGPCCKKAKELIAQIEPCCRKVLAGGEKRGCCTNMKP